MAEDVNSILGQPRTVDVIAEVVHDQWVRWQKYLHGQCERRADGSLVIPAQLVERWERQISTPFAELSPQEQESDRELAVKYVNALRMLDR